MEPLLDNPSLKNPDNFQEKFNHAYELAILKAASETNLEETTFPTHCEWDIEQILNDEFFPN